jgi:DNA end-binding protein Ku
MTWKGFLTLAQMSCAVRLHPAVVRIDRLGFQALNRTTLNRVQMRSYDPQTGKEVSRDAVLRGYEVEPGRFVVVEDRELAELQLESSRNVVLSRFVDPAAIDAAYLDAPYFVAPDSPASGAAYALIREAMKREGRGGIGRIVLGNRERAALVVPRGSGMLLTTLRAAAEVRSDDTFFAEIGDAAPDEGLLSLTCELVTRRTGEFDPRRDFRDRYQEALFQLVQAKLKGEKPVLPPAPPPARVLDPRDALALSVAAEMSKPPAPSRHADTARQAKNH